MAAGRLAHVLEHCDTDEPTGTWTGVAGPDHALALGSDVDNAQLRAMCRGGVIADMIWEAQMKSPPSTTRRSRLQ